MFFVLGTDIITGLLTKASTSPFSQQTYEVSSKYTMTKDTLTPTHLLRRLFFAYIDLVKCINFHFVTNTPQTVTHAEVERYTIQKRADIFSFHQ